MVGTITWMHNHSVGNSYVWQSASKLKPKNSMDDQLCPHYKIL